MPENRQSRQKRANRTSFQPGRSGNPGGRPAEFADFRRMAREEGAPVAWATLMRNMACGDPAEETKAALGVLAYAWGKPSQAVEVSGPEGKPIESRSEVMSVGPDKIGQVIGVLAKAGVFPASTDAGATPAGDEAEVE